VKKQATGKRGAKVAVKYAFDKSSIYLSAMFAFPMKTKIRRKKNGRKL